MIGVPMPRPRCPPLPPLRVTAHASASALNARLEDEVAQLRRQNAQLARELALPVNIYLQR